MSLFRLPKHDNWTFTLLYIFFPGSFVRVTLDVIEPLNGIGRKTTTTFINSEVAVPFSCARTCKHDYEWVNIEYLASCMAKLSPKDEFMFKLGREYAWYIYEAC